MNGSRTSAITAIAALGDPLRRELATFVYDNAHPVSRDDAAAALGIARSTAAFHLDRLVTDGVLDVEYKRLSGKSGPGAGRPSKLYRRVDEEISASIPPRHYDLAAELFAESVSRAENEGMPVREALDEVATETGATIGAAAESLTAALTAGGYEPRDDGEGGLYLTNCPFHSLTRRHSELICTANVALLTGLARGANDTDNEICQVPPVDGRCCVRVVPRERSSVD